MKLLAIGAHPDDIEIFMYGFVALCKRKKDEIFLAVASDGASGGQNKDNKLVQTREKETKLGLKFLGKPILLGLHDGKLDEDLRAQAKIKTLINEIEPDLIITHAPEDYHPDHRALSKYVLNAASFKSPVLFSDTLMGVNFKPEIYVDITDFFKDKLNAIDCHKSQNPKKFSDATKLLNRFRSAQCNGPDNHYAEAYRYQPKFPFADIRSLLPNAPIYRPYYSNKSEGFL